MSNLFKKIHKGEQKTLQCNHMFHSSCIRQWALKSDSKIEILEFKKPIKNRIHLFKKGENIFTCPCCRIEYTHDAMTSEIKRVFLRKFI